MKLKIDLPTETSLALRRLSAWLDVEPEEAAAIALRDHLIGPALLEPEPQKRTALPRN